MGTQASQVPLVYHPAPTYGRDTSTGHRHKSPSPQQPRHRSQSAAAKVGTHRTSARDHDVCGANCASAEIWETILLEPTRQQHDLPLRKCSSIASATAQHVYCDCPAATRVWNDLKKRRGLGLTDERQFLVRAFSLTIMEPLRQAWTELSKLIKGSTEELAEC